MKRQILSWGLAILLSVPAYQSQAGQWESIGGTSDADSRKASSSQSIGGGSSSRGISSSRSDEATSSDPDTALAQMAAKYEKAVGLVTLVIPGLGPNGFGTAWAIGPNTYATNSHITEPIKRYKKWGWDVYIAVNHTPQKRFKVLSVKSHPKYGETSTTFEGKRSVSFTNDVGLITIDGTAPAYFPIANDDELKRIKPGYRVAFLGYPMEGLSAGNVDPFNPLATMQSGIVTTMSNYNLGDTGFENNVLLRHNMGATGGASGSPIFNTRGEVVGILNAGNIVMVAQPDYKGRPKWRRTPNAAMINFAQRIDLLEGVPR